LEVARDCRHLSEGGPDVAVIEGSPRQSRRSEVGLNVAVIKYSPRKSQVDATAIQGAIRESHRAEGGLAVVTNRGATVRSHRHSEGGIDIASRQARDKQAQYLNAQQAHLECEIGKEFLSGYHAKQNYDDLSDLAPVEVTNPGIQPVIVDEMQRLLSISGSANLQHRLQSLCREFSDIFLSTVRVCKQRQVGGQAKQTPTPFSYQRQGCGFKKADHLLGVSRGCREIDRLLVQSSTSSA
jgi:hypothetical protein